MAKSASSRGWKVARGTSLLLRLTQYLQSYTQLFVISTFNREMHRPSAEKLWQIPQAIALPIPPFSEAPRSTPLEVQATSYFAESDSIFSFSSVCMPISPYLSAVMMPRMQTDLLSFIYIVLSYSLGRRKMFFGMRREVIILRTYVLCKERKAGYTKKVQF